MSDPSPEKTETSRDWQNLPILSRDTEGKRVSPMKINLTNLDLRINGDRDKYIDLLNKINEKRGVLKIEASEYKTVDKLLAAAHGFIQKWRDKETTTLEDFRPVATYLDWSYQQQFGVPASSSSFDKASANGEIAMDLMLLFKNIQGKLNGNN